MDISQDLIIDAALNAAGYLTAALLSIVFYSIFFRRNSSHSGSFSPSAPDPKISAVRDNGPAPTGSGEFIKLGGENTQAISIVRPNYTSQPDNISKAGRRDRSSIVAIAAKMLKAGAGADKIKNVLPISEAELSLLKQSQKI